MTGLREGLSHYLIFLAVMTLENFAGIGLGMCLSASFTSVEMAPQLAPAFVILFLMFSGFFLNESNVPVWLIWLREISFIRYAFQALCVNEFKGAEFSCDGSMGSCVDGDEHLLSGSSLTTSPSAETAASRDDCQPASSDRYYRH